MYIKKKMRTKLILLAIAVLIFLYWHGIQKVSAQKGWNCEYHLVYSVCNAKNNKATLPSLWDILKAGAKF